MTRILETFNQIKAIIDERHRDIVEMRYFTKSNDKQLKVVLKNLIQLFDLNFEEKEKAFQYIEELDYD